MMIPPAIIIQPGYTVFLHLMLLASHLPFSWLSPCKIAFIPDCCPAVCILTSTVRHCPVHIIDTPLVCHTLFPFINHIVCMYIIYPDLPAQPLFVDSPWRWIQSFKASETWSFHSSGMWCCVTESQPRQQNPWLHTVTTSTVVWFISMERLLCNAFWKALKRLFIYHWTFDEGDEYSPLRSQEP